MANEGSCTICEHEIATYCGVCEFCEPVTAIYVCTLCMPENTDEEKYGDNYDHKLMELHNEKYHMSIDIV